MFLQVVLCFTLLMGAIGPAKSFAKERGRVLKNDSNQLPRWRPERGKKWHLQYIGDIIYLDEHEIFNLDLFDVDPWTIKWLHSQGKKVICYFSAGTREEWRSDAWDFPDEVIGRRNRRWSGERWLDTSKRDLIRPVMEGRIRLAKEKGCDAVDPDNVDGYVNRTGFDLTPEDALHYSRMLADIAHSYGLSIGLKNSVELIDQLVDWFDFAVNESCYDYDECWGYKAFVDQGKPVYQIQYHYSPWDLCARSKELGMNSIIKGVKLDAWSDNCFDK